jgi:DNA-binding Lrp family transcriptional regulator
MTKPASKTSISSSIAVDSPVSAPLRGPRDALDRQLIALLQTNARSSTAHLARKLGVARTTVVARLARLEADGVILGYAVRLGAEALDRGVQAYVGISISPKAQREVVRRLSQLPELSRLASVSGGFDLFALVSASSTSKLNTILDEIGELEGVIKTNTYVVLALRIDR